MRMLRMLQLSSEAQLQGLPRVGRRSPVALRTKEIGVPAPFLLRLTEPMMSVVFSMSACLSE